VAGKLRLCFADTETTGLAESVEDAIENNRQVIEYAFKIWEEGHVVRSFEQKVMPTGYGLEDAIDCAAKGYNHFDRAQWWASTRNSREYHIAVPWSLHDCDNVIEYVGGETLAGSNPRFDLVMFKAEFARLRVTEHFPALATHRMMNTGDLAWLLWSVRLVEKTGLETLTKFFDLPHKAHTAMGDVDACIAVFETMVDTLVRGPRRMRDLCQALIEELPSKEDRTAARAALARHRVL
jgi:hypothetical protein